MKKIAEREAGRLQQEIERLQKDLDELKERKNIHEVRILVIQELSWICATRYVSLIFNLIQHCFWHPEYGGLSHNNHHLDGLSLFCMPLLNNNLRLQVHEQTTSTSISRVPALG